MSVKVRFLIKFSSMKKYAHILGEENKLSNSVDDKQLADLTKYIVNVKRVSKYSFWRTKCFEEAFTLKRIFENHNQESTIYFGVAKNEDKELNAHAWLKIGDKVIIGGNGHEKYTVTKYFT